MKYYLITRAQYESQKIMTELMVACTLDHNKCVVEVANDYSMAEFVRVFEDGNEFNAWRYDESAEEWRNWMTEEDFFGI